MKPRKSSRYFMLTSTVPVAIYLADKITNYFCIGHKKILYLEQRILFIICHLVLPVKMFAVNVQGVMG